MTGLVMAGYSYEAVMDMPWTDARDFWDCVLEERRARWIDMAAAMRLAHASQEDWERVVREARGGK